MLNADAMATALENAMSESVINAITEQYKNDPAGLKHACMKAWCEGLINYLKANLVVNTNGLQAIYTNPQTYQTITSIVNQDTTIK